MKLLSKRIKVALFALTIAGSFGFGAAQALNTGGMSATHPDTGCPLKPGCRYGGGKIGCCVLP
ncbi:hypothetical protein [Montanilutibacter psychrotolerans]|uniref:Uncharacterized protein n=1 Tax=Montanilutibacter psychrotolerans TaxID=1327343 RepID=A0A3M8SWX9_9GAMM|nr:hypothetical protein [Lysobacter psychrotolerans]RNF83724.1 hypothetical protein EER27_10135 [Lysobacter psychrotolerans]